MITGTTGFLGKVWLAKMLYDLGDVPFKAYVLIRKKGLRPVEHRFEKFAGTSPVFKPLHERHGAGLGAWLAERIEVIEGDISQPNFGMDDEVAARLKKDLDVIINCAGLVDFSPDVRLGLSSNVDGAVYAAEFTAACDHASLVHVSTCYVAGARGGRIAEEIGDRYAPNGEEFDPEAELAAVRAEIDAILAEQEDPSSEDALRDDVMALIRERGLDENNATLVRNMTHRHRQQRVKILMTKLGEKRAAMWGWCNTYTYTKSIAEQLLKKVGAEKGTRYSVVRPAIVESSVRFPFPGWNEGFNTSGPLVYLLGTWFKHLPARAETPFDVVPVDLVCNALSIAGAGLLAGQEGAVYHAGTSDKNQFTIGRALDLSALGHRRYYRKHGESALQRVLLSRWDGTVSKPGHLLSIHNVRKTARGLKGLLHKLPNKVPKQIRKQAEMVGDGLGEIEKGLKPVQKACDLFLPFIHDTNWIFAADGLANANVVEPEFRFSTEDIDWRSYWLDVHMPGLRKWCFPQLEGKPTPAYKPAHPFKFERALPEAAARARAEG